MAAAEAISPLGDGLFAASFAQADVGLVHVSLDGRIIRANRNFCDLLGYSEAEIVGRDKLTLVAAGAGASLARDLESLRRGERQSYAVERSYLTKSGASIDAWTAARLIGAPPTILLVIENVTARRAAEAALRESEERFELAMRGANEGLYDWRVDDQPDLSFAALEKHARLPRG